MRNRFFIMLIILINFSLLNEIDASARNHYSSAPTDRKNISILPGKIIIKFKASLGDNAAGPAAQAVFNQCQAQQVEKLFKNHKPLKKVDTIGLDRIYQVQVDDNMSITEMCKSLNRLPEVEYAEPVYVCHPEAVPNDPFYSRQYFLPQIKAEAAWDIAKGDSNIIIGIVDTGVDWDHPDLASIIWRNPNEAENGSDSDNNGFVDDIRGWDFVTGQGGSAAEGEDGDRRDNDPMDFNGHGTHCSGLAAGATNNATGIASISWGCRIMPLRVGYENSSGDGVGFSSWMAEAFVYATDNGASVVSLSFENGGQVIRDAARYAHKNGVVVVTSAGNGDNEEKGGGINNLPFVVKVAAVDRNDNKAWYSTYGDWITVSAPGGNHRPGLYSTYFNDRYFYASGTSMASPLTAGLVGLVKSFHPDWTPSRLIFQVVDTADDIDNKNPAYPGKMGTGRINALRALTETVTAVPKMKLLSYSVLDQVTGNGNGVVDIGETVQIAVNLQNSWATGYNIVVALEVDDWAVKVTKGSANFGTVYGIEDIDQMNNTSNADDPFEMKIDSLALPHRVKAKIVISGDEGYRQEYAFTMAVNPSILYVDDAEIDISSYYIRALDNLGYSFERWSHQYKGVPINLTDYSTVIWNCEWTFPSLDATDRLVIQNYLNNGGSLFLSGQDIGWDLCEPITGDENEYTRSSGASKTFYENYLHTEYLLDDSEYSSLEGVAGDPISENLHFDVEQPNRAADEQFPDEINPFNGGISIFDYPNNNSGAVRFAGDYRVVYLAFGGYEAIMDSAARQILMTRTLNWLNGLSVFHTPLDDTENTTADYEVQAVIKSSVKPIKKAELYWDEDGELPLAHKITMEAIDDTTYQAYIPAQSGGKIMYTIFAQNEAGFYNSYEFNSFRVGQDQIPPTITNVSPVPNTLDRFGPWSCQLQITDNMSIDTSAVWLYYGQKEQTLDSLKMNRLTGSIFLAEIPASADYGDTLVYYAKARDVAASPNYTESEQYEFVIGFDDFEDQTLRSWINENGWGSDSTKAHSGVFAATESPYRNLGPSENAALQLKAPLDLSASENTLLTFWQQYSFHRNNAYGYFEASVDSGQTWDVLHQVTGIRRTWGQVVLSLNEYAGNPHLLIRFRTESSSAANDRFLGWLIDDVQIRTGIPQAISSGNGSVEIPDNFVLLQNYPNPFNPATKISFGLPKAAHISLKIYNLLGREVKTLVDSKQPAGHQQVVWDGTNNAGLLLSSGIYFYQLKTESFLQTRKMMWMK